MACGTSTPPVVEVVMGAGGAMTLLTAVAGGRTLGRMGNSRPATTRTPRPSTTAATVANRFDDPPILPSTDAVWMFLSILTDAAGARAVDPHHATMGRSVRGLPHGVSIPPAPLAGRCP